MAEENGKQVLLSFRNISKEFPGVKALDGISFDIMRGEVHVLLGENGAGKSTLMRILVALMEPSSGEVEMYGYNLWQ